MQPPQPALDRSRAWACVAANLLLWPGLGNAMAKRKVGLVQMGISAAGLVMVVIGLVGFFARWFDSAERPGLDDPYVLTALLGLGLFALTWIWALFGSIGLIRSSAKAALLPPRVDTP